MLGEVPPNDPTFRVFPRSCRQRSAFNQGPLPPPHARSRSSQGERYYIWSVDSVCEAITYLISRTFFTFGDRTFHQTVGIPMGTNPAVHMATLLLFTYELSFARRCTAAILTGPSLFVRHITPNFLPLLQTPTPQELYLLRKGIAFFLLDQFKFKLRFIDDLFPLGNSVFCHLCFETDVFLGFPGIYPAVLQLTASIPARTTDFLDMHIITLTSNFLTSELYDKRRELKFAHIALIRFPHISSNLSMRCKYNCLVGEFHRFRRIILSRGNFTFELARVLVQLHRRGYDLHRLLYKTSALLHSHPHLFATTPAALLRSVRSWLPYLFARGLFPYPPPPPPMPAP